MPCCEWLFNLGPAYHRDLFTACLMGFTAGYTTANTKVRFNTFGGMMTGNTVKVGITLAQGDYVWTGIYLACIFLFALGTVFSLFMIQKLKGNAQKYFLIVFCICFLLTDALALAVDRDDNGEYNEYASLISSLAAFALGAQNLLSQKAGLIKANTTFMTGNIQKMAEALWNMATKKGGLKPDEERAAFLLFCTWLPYILGGVVGTTLAKTTSWSLTPAAVLYGLGMWSMEVDPPKKKKPEAAEPAPKKAEPQQAAAASDPVVPATEASSDIEMGSAKPAAADPTPTEVVPASVVVSK